MSEEGFKRKVENRFDFFLRENSDGVRRSLYAVLLEMSLKHVIALLLG